jgi:hypothetical protein
MVSIGESAIVRSTESRRSVPRAGQDRSHAIYILRPIGKIVLAEREQDEREQESSARHHRRRIASNTGLHLPDVSRGCSHSRNHSLGWLRTLRGPTGSPCLRAGGYCDKSRLPLFGRLPVPSTWACSVVVRHRTGTCGLSYVPVAHLEIAGLRRRDRVNKLRSGSGVPSGQSKPRTITIDPSIEISLAIDALMGRSGW